MICFLGRLSMVLTAMLLAAGCGQEQSTNGSQSLRVAATVGPHSLDPRSARILVDATVLNMLYEGLMRFTASGALAPGVAESVAISSDLTTYTFHLRQSFWSNGDPVTANEFAVAWKHQLEPHSPAPNAFLLYMIKNARSAKMGTVPINNVGVTAVDAHTLVVELEEPTPHFLQLTAFYALFPVHHTTDHAPGMVSNGPFKLEHYSPNDQLTAIKNPHYWEASAVNLDKINIVVVDDSTALNLFETGALDWVGSPLSTVPNEALVSLNDSPYLKSVPSAAIHFLRFNVDQAPLNHPKIRRALALAINRRELIDHVILGNQMPATGLIPNSAQWEATQYFQDNDIAMARQLLAEALGELKLDALQPITLIYVNNPRSNKLAQALQQQWQQYLGLWVNLQNMEGKHFLERLKAQDYQIANGSWFADFDDPINFLDVFSAKDNGTNNTGWENFEFQALLKQSKEQVDASQRLAILKKAEQLLVSEMPIAPIFYYQLNYLQAPGFEGIGIAPLGIQIFREGSLSGRKITSL